MNEPTKLYSSGILTREQLAEELKVKEATIASWEEDHNFPGRKAGRTTLYDVEAIREWIKAGK